METFEQCKFTPNVGSHLILVADFKIYTNKVYSKIESVELNYECYRIVILK